MLFPGRDKRVSFLPPGGQGIGARLDFASSAADTTAALQQAVPQILAYATSGLSY